MNANDIARDLKCSLEDAGFSGTITLCAPLAPFTTYGIGGPAALMAEALSVNDLRLFNSLLAKHELPLLVLGAGSNILVADEGFDGAVIRLSGEFTEIEAGGEIIKSGSAVPVARVVREGARIGLEQIVRLVGIPGWIGGAIAMNAGTFGEYMDGILDSVTVLMKDNEVVTLDPDQCEFGYRTSRFLKTGEIILRCEISGELVDPDLLAPEIRTRLLRRGDTQPIDCPSCGCVFRNPPGEQSAARLIQEAGLKGERRGGAVISDKHANFIVNDRNAKAVDILELMALARNRVRERFAVMLLPEVQAYGFPTTLEGMLNAIHDS